MPPTRRSSVAALFAFSVAVGFAVVVVSACAGRPAGGPAPAASRPPITGIASVSIWVTDPAKSIEFYSQVLGLPRATGPADRAAPLRFPVNDHQLVELRPAGPSAPANLLAEVAFETSDVLRMRAYVLSTGLGAGPIAADATGAHRFDVADPEGHRVAFVERVERGTIRGGPEQVGERIFHAGFIVRDRAAADRFYRDLLGFRMYWHGGMSDPDTDWVELQVPEGSDWIEYMLNVPLDAGREDVGVMNHFSLGVAAIQPTAARLHAHGYRSNDQPEIGRDGKWQFDVFDPDGTRVEFMEPAPARPPCCHPYEAPHPSSVH